MWSRLRLWNESMINVSWLILWILEWIIISEDKASASDHWTAYFPDGFDFTNILREVAAWVVVQRMAGQPFDERLPPPIVLIQCLESILRKHFYHILIRPLDICYDVDLTISPLLRVYVDIALEPRQFWQAARAEVGHPRRLSSVELIWTGAQLIRAYEAGFGELGVWPSYEVRRPLINFDGSIRLSFGRD